MDSLFHLLKAIAGRFRQALPLLSVLVPDIAFSQAPPQDCLDAITVCSNTYVQTNTFSGFGSVLEILPAGNSCLGNGETNSSWYLFKIKNPGNLLIDITPASCLGPITATL